MDGKKKYKQPAPGHANGVPVSLALALGFSIVLLPVPMFLLYA